MPTVERQRVSHGEQEEMQHRTRTPGDLIAEVEDAGGTGIAMAGGGALIGALAGPEGALVGALIGLIVGVFLGRQQAPTR